LVPLHQTVPSKRVIRWERTRAMRGSVVPLQQRVGSTAGDRDERAAQATDSSYPTRAFEVLESDLTLQLLEPLERVGPYLTAFELGQGGMATVYLAVNKSAGGFQKAVALKRIHPHLGRNKAFAEMFMDEARIAASVHHASVCQVFDLGFHDDGPYLAMEYLVGESLAAIAKRLKLAPELKTRQHQLMIARVMVGLAEGLHAVHNLADETGAGLNVVHRDATPHNLFVLYDGSVRVTDRAREASPASYGGTEHQRQTRLRGARATQSGAGRSASRCLVAWRCDVGIANGEELVPVSNRRANCHGSVRQTDSPAIAITSLCCAGIG